MKRLGEPPGAREQVVIIWNPERDQPEGSLNTSQNGLLECARRIVMQETPSGGALGVKLLINRSQEPALMGRCAKHDARVCGTLGGAVCGEAGRQAGRQWSKD